LQSAPAQSLCFILQHARIEWIDIKFITETNKDNLSFRDCSAQWQF